MSLKQFLIEQDRLNFANKTGQVATQAEGEAKARKRKLGDVEMDVSEATTSKRRKVTTDGFLDCGSVSWSLLLAIFMLSLHRSEVIDEGDQKFCMTYESCLEMLEVLASEFGDMIPLETGSHVLEATAPGALAKLRENSLI